MAEFNRRTLSQIPYTPDPKEIYQELIQSPGWPYKSRRKESYLIRDRSLVALTYLGAFRISEVLRIETDQFQWRDDYVEVKSVELSKSVVEGKPRNDIYREARLPLVGERRPLTQLVLNHLERVPYGRLYKFTRQRAWQIFQALLPEHTCHWFRAYGEAYLYDAWGSDILAVSDYVKVDAGTLQQYIRGRWRNKKVA